MFQLLPSQRAAVYELLKAFDFNPVDFEIVKTNQHQLGDGEAVKLKKTEFYFAIFNHPGQYSPSKFIVTFSPGVEEIAESGECYDWNSMVGRFENYLHVLRRELAVRDPWENAKEYADKLQTVPRTDGGDHPFTGRNKDDIQKILEDIKHLLLDQVRNDKKKQQYVTDQFRMLHDAVTKFGKKDYLMLV